MCVCARACLADSWLKIISHTSFIWTFCHQWWALCGTFAVRDLLEDIYHWERTLWSYSLAPIHVHCVSASWMWMTCNQQFSSSCSDTIPCLLCLLQCLYHQDGPINLELLLKYRTARRNKSFCPLGYGFDYVFYHSNRKVTNVIGNFNANKMF